MSTTNKIAIVSIAKDIELSFLQDFKTVMKSFADFDIYRWIIVESNSADKSLDILNDYASKFDFIHIKSISNNEVGKPRTSHLASARNECLNILKELNVFDEIDYLVVYDLNYLNKGVTRESVKSCWQRDGWDAVTANQNGPYYDVFALRHRYWNNEDCWQTYRHMHDLYPKNFRFIWDSALWGTVYSKMIKIDKKSEWIRVDSAFGGIAIYKPDLIRDARYIGLTEDGLEVCEHVSFNKTIQQKGGSIYINPKFINFKLTDHSKRRKYFVYYNMKYYIVRGVQKLIDKVKSGK